MQKTHRHPHAHAAPAAQSTGSDPTQASHHARPGSTKKGMLQRTMLDLQYHYLPTTDGT